MDHAASIKPSTGNACYMTVFQQHFESMAHSSCIDVHNTRYICNGINALWHARNKCNHWHLDTQIRNVENRSRSANGDDT